jgi:hypothetical protein
MNKERKLINFITELIKKTISKEIVWEKIETPSYLSNGTESIVSLCFRTKYNKKDFILFERKYQQYSFDFDTLYWTNEFKLGILEDDIVIWENTENISNIKDLYNQVQEKVSGIDDILDNL